MESSPHPSPAGSDPNPGRWWRGPARWAIVGLVLALAATATGVAISDAAGLGFDHFVVAGVVLWALLALAFAACGALIVLKQPENTVGWILLIPPLGMLGALLPAARSAVAPTTVDAWALVQVWIENMSWMLLFFPIFHLLLVFPTGRLLSRRWRWLVVLEVVMFVTLAGLGAFAERVGPLEQSWTVENPIGFVPDGFFEGLFGTVWGIGLITLTFSGVIAVALRFRRADHLERQQIKWLLLAVTLFGLSYAVSGLNEAWQGNPIADLVLVTSVAAIPVAIAVAILRYRLFDIDLVIRRTILYSVVVGLVGSAFVLIIAVLTQFLPSDEPLVVAVATLGSVAMFNPLRARIRTRVERRFNRSRFDAQQVIDEFVGSLRDQVDPGAVATGWVGVVGRTMQPSTVGVWIREP